MLDGKLPSEPLSAWEFESHQVEPPSDYQGDKYLARSLRWPLSIISRNFWQAAGPSGYSRRLCPIPRVDQFAR